MSSPWESGKKTVNTVVVGLDAACFPVLEDVLEESDAPTLRATMESGLAAPLESQLPPWTASAWPSIYTGVNPGKHGVFDFLTFDGYEWDVVNRTWVREHALWELLARHGLTSVVVNVPVTHPPREFDGALVPGYVAPESPDCHPPGLWNEIRNEVGEYRVYPSVPEDAGRRARVDEYRELVRLRGETFRYLVDRFEPAFGFLQFQQTDSVFHELPGDDEAVRAVYRAVDAQLDRTLEACQPERVVVVSDHGIGEYDGYGFRTNEFLRNRGYVETVRGGEGMPSWTAAASLQPPSQADEAGVESVWQRGLTRAAELGAKAGLTAQRAEAVLERVGLAEFVADRVPVDAIRAGTEQVDFPASRAYMRSRLELGVRLNLAGREPDGTVPRDEYERVRARLADSLREVRTPDGERLFESVLPREEVFEGPYVDEGPDLLTVPSGFDHLPTAALLGDEFGEPDEPWEHKPEGLLVAAGRGIDADGDAGDAHIFDVAPTVLALMGVPVGERMDGTVLPFVGRDDVDRRAYPAFECTDTAPTDDRQIEKQLSDLGYI